MTNTDPFEGVRRIHLDHAETNTMFLDGEKNWNDWRASCAAQAVLAFANRTNQIVSGDPTEVINDLLGDLQHLCIRLDIDFDRVLDAARHNFSEELAIEAEDAGVGA